MTDKPIIAETPISQEFKGCSYPVPTTSTLSASAQEAVTRECRHPITPRITQQEDMHPWGLD